MISLWTCVVYLIAIVAVDQGCKFQSEFQSRKMSEDLGLGEKKVERKKVIIIGGGASGIATAERLDREGETDFLVLEAANQIGGRVRSEKVGTGEERVEFGAQWIHGQEGNVVYELAKKWGMLEKASNKEEDEEEEEEGEDDEEAVYLSQGGERIASDLIQQFETVFNRIQENLDILDPGELKNYSSKGDFFTTSLQKELQEEELQGVKCKALQYLQWYGRLQASIDGSPSWWNSALNGDQVYEECPGDQETTLSKDTNYQALIEKLGSGVVDRVVLGERVLGVTQVNNSSVQVETQSTVYQCEYVVVTVSLGVLKEEIIEFSPTLPQEKISAIENMGFGVVTKVFLEYKDDVRTLVPDLTDDGIYFLRKQEGEEPAKPWGNLPSSPWQEGIFCLWPDHINPRLVSVWLQGSGALKVETMSQASFLPLISSFLSEYLTPSHPLSHPISATSTTWGTEPTTLGSYSYISPTTPPTAPASLASPVGRILFAGEATHSTHFSTVHGAIESGQREADRILGLLANYSGK